ncbi:hypothetical protein M1N92_03430 [Dehalococcoidia bacterium]|nr:hypothetical protein [Dehalococcoidia bacterium]
MRIEDIGRSLGIQLSGWMPPVATVQETLDHVEACGSHANPNAIEPDNEKEDSESRK